MLNPLQDSATGEATPTRSISEDGSWPPALISRVEETSDLTPFLSRARHYVYQSRSANTLRGYNSDWRHFSRFSKALGIEPMPARPEMVASYLSACADSGLTAGSIQRRVSAIAAVHNAAGYDSPASGPAVKLCLAGIRRALGIRQEGKRPTLTTDLAAMCSHLPAGLLGIRDRAILLIGFSGAFRRSELVGLDFEDLAFGDDGVRITIRRSKTDQEGAGQVIGIARGMNLCPVAALQAWLSAAAITSGPVLRSVTRHGSVNTSRLTGQVVALVVKRWSAVAGLESAKYSGHSLRAGMVTQATLNGVSEGAIMRQTRHRSSEMLQRLHSRCKSISGQRQRPAGVVTCRRDQNGREPWLKSWLTVHAIIVTKKPYGPRSVNACRTLPQATPAAARTRVKGPH